MCGTDAYVVGSWFADDPQVICATGDKVRLLTYGIPAKMLKERCVTSQGYVYFEDEDPAIVGVRISEPDHVLRPVCLAISFSYLDWIYLRLGFNHV